MPNEQHVAEVAQRLTDDFRSYEPLVEASDKNRLVRSVAWSMDRALEQLAETRCWGPENRLLSSILWNASRQWLEKGTLQRRAREKPRGYAGDYQLLDRIWRSDTALDPWGEAFDRFFQDQAAPQAVRNRIRIAADFIVEAAQRSVAAHSTGGPSAFGRPLHVVSFGSGPAHDVRLALERIPEITRRTIQVTLVDMDPEALEFAGQPLRSVLNDDQIVLERRNLFRLARPGGTAFLSPVDALVCTGLFDYLENGEASASLSTLRQTLAPGGELLVFNFSPSNPTRTYMEWIGNWYLLYRDRQMMRELGEFVRQSMDELTVGAETQEVNLYLKLRAAPAVPR